MAKYDWMSPRELNDNPEKWLNIPHELHEVLRSLQEKMFPGFVQKLEDKQVHCLECDGHEPFAVYVVTEGKTRLCDGYVGSTDDPDNLLLHTKDIPTETEVDADGSQNYRAS
jgi:hypothetical protein